MTRLLHSSGLAMQRERIHQPLVSVPSGPRPQHRAMSHASRTIRPGPTAGGEAQPRVLTLKDGRGVALRSPGPGDLPAVQQFVRGLSDAARRNRFFAPVRELSPGQLDRITHSRPPHALALVGETAQDGQSRIVALAQYASCEPLDAEVGLVVDDSCQRQGLGMQLLGVLEEHAARAGLATLSGFVLADNWPMLGLLARLGWEFITDYDRYMIRFLKQLEPPRPAT